MHGSFRSFFCLLLLTPRDSLLLTDIVVRGLFLPSMGTRDEFHGVIVQFVCNVRFWYLNFSRLNHLMVAMKVNVVERSCIVVEERKKNHGRELQSGIAMAVIGCVLRMLVFPC